MAAKKGGKRGPKPGVSKRHARPFAPGFGDRLRLAMARRPELIKPGGETRDSVLAEKVGCTGAAIGAYLAGKRQTVDTLLLFDLCDALSVTPYWLALNQGSVDDLPLNEKPFEVARFKAAKVRRVEEKRIEANR